MSKALRIGLGIFIASTVYLSTNIIIESLFSPSSYATISTLPRDILPWGNLPLEIFRTFITIFKRTSLCSFESSSFLLRKWAPLWLQIWMADPVRTKLLEKALFLHVLAIQDSGLWDLRLHTHNVVCLEYLPSLCSCSWPAPTHPSGLILTHGKVKKAGKEASLGRKWPVFYQKV